MCCFVNFSENFQFKISTFKNNFSLETLNLFYYKNHNHLLLSTTDVALIFPRKNDTV